MKYSIEIGKIVEGALKHDQCKVINYTKQLIDKLNQDGDKLAANKFSRQLAAHNGSTLSIMGMNKELSVPVDSESRTVLADVIYPNDNRIDVILSKENRENIDTFILSYKNADRLNSIGIGVANTLLLYGPPGCGKTQCAYLIARELGLPLIIARLDSLISSYLGTTAKNIRSLFEFAQKMPCVLFLDEFDAIAKARDDSNELGELKRVVNSLLQNVDAMSKDSLLIAATNHDKLLDSAVWRRFEYKLEIQLPDTNAIIEMIDLFTKQAHNLNAKEKMELATALTGLSGANIEEVLVKAIRKSVIQDKSIEKIDFYNELFEFKGIIPQNGVSKNTLLGIKTSFLRNCNEKIFSYQVIADILKSSKTTIAKVIREANT